MLVTATLPYKIKISLNFFLVKKKSCFQLSSGAF